METIIVSRHAGAIEWLRKHHPELGEARILAHVDEDDLRKSRVVGTLPIHLAAICQEYWHLQISIPQEYRGRELSLEHLEEFGAEVRQYWITDGNEDLGGLEELLRDRRLEK